MMDIDNISVVVPTYNALPMLMRTIASLEKQQPDPTLFEVIVVVDGSIDGTAEWLNKYAGPLRIQSFVFSENKGRSAARNNGADLARGELLVFIDGDMEFSSDFIRGHAARHAEGRIGVMGRVVYDKGISNRGYARYLETRGAVKLKHGESLPGRYFLSGNVSISRFIFQETGGFDENIRIYGEDIDLGMRLVNAGVKLVFAQELTVKHLHLRPIESVLELAYRYGKESIPQLIRKHPVLYKQLRLDWLDQTGMTRLIHRTLMSEPVFATVKVLTRMLNKLVVPAFLYDYLLYRCYYSGYKESLD